MRHGERIAFLVILFGYAVSAKSTRERFSEIRLPWAQPFMALLGRDRLPSRSALSRALAARLVSVIEALRTLFLADVLARPLGSGTPNAGRWDRPGQHWWVCALDGRREATRQCALPRGDHLPEPQRRLAAVGAPGSTGRKQDAVIRTRTTI